MKKALFLTVLSISLFGLSCTPDEINEETTTAEVIQQRTEPDQQCPPNDRNCNGIPDDEETDK